LASISGAAMPPYLVIQALDDLWVPADGAMALAASPSARVQVQLTSGGEHGSFHGIDDDPGLCLSDRLTAPSGCA